MDGSEPNLLCKKPACDRPALSAPVGILVQRWPFRQWERGPG